MTPGTTKTSGWSTVALVASLFFLYLGERMADGATRWAVSGLAVALFIGGVIVLGIIRLMRTDGPRRAAIRRLLIDYALCAVALLLYVVQTDDLGLFTDGGTRDVLRLLSPTFLVAGLFPAIAIELSLRSDGDSPEFEGWRIALADRAARIIVLSVVAFAGINYAANKWNRKIDLSYFKTTEVGSSNVAMVESITQPLEILLFFPPGNEVLEHVLAYTEELARHSELATIKVVDQALDADLSRTFKVRANGYLALGVGDRRETLRVGLDIEGATSNLRKLDLEVQEMLNKVLQPPRIVYFTTGHLERDFAPPADDKRRGLSDFKQVLSTLGYTTKRLGLGEGLGSEIPEDATLVIVAGPLEPFLPQEVEAMHRYLDRGGRVMFFFDPDNGVTGNDILLPLGVEVSRALVATDNLRHLWRIEGQSDSPYYITTNNVSSHPTMTTFSRNRARLATLLAGAGQVKKTESPPAAMQTTFTLRSMTGSWLDENANGSFDKDGEKRSTYDLAAAIAAEAKVEHAQATRAVVFADCDFIGDLIVRNQGNYIVIMDALRWLAGDETLIGTVESEKDVRITHRRDEDRIWFYGSSVLAPVGVLLAGLFYTRWLRRPRRPRKGGKEK